MIDLLTQSELAPPTGPCARLNTLYLACRACISYFSGSCDQIPPKGNRKGEGLVWAHSLRQCDHGDRDVLANFMAARVSYLDRRRKKSMLAPPLPFVMPSRPILGNDAILTQGRSRLLI